MVDGSTAAPGPPQAPRPALMTPAFGWFLTSAGSWFFAFGMHQTMIARLVVGDLQASDEVTGTVQAAMMLAGLLLLFPGGAIADRVDPRRLLVWTHLLGALPPLALAAAVFTDSLTIPILLLCAIALGGLNPFGFPAREAMCWRLGSAQIERAVTTQTMVQFGFQAIGMRIVDLARIFGSGPLLVVQGVAAAAGALPASRLPSAASVPKRERPKLSDMLAGLRIVWNSDLRWVWILLFGVGLFFGGAFWTVVPLLLRARFGHVDDLGAVLFFFQFGTMLGSAALLWRGGIRRKGRALVLALSTGGIVILGLAQSLPLWGMQAAIFIWGLAGSVFMNMSRTLFQARAPEAERARVLSMNQLGFMAAGPIGASFSGFLSGWLGPPDALFALGCAMLTLVGVVALVSPILEME